jgi:DMSO/TMAO reductase YedYZ molybdopterin-dependent catalytic subunit
LEIQLFFNILPSNVMILNNKPPLISNIDSLNLMKKRKVISRRQFLQHVGKLFGGVAFGSALVSQGCKQTPTHYSSQPPNGQTLRPTPSATTSMLGPTQTTNQLTGSQNFKSMPPLTNPVARPTQTSIDELYYLVGKDPSTVDESGLPVTPSDMQHVAGGIREVDMSDYRLSVYGLVEKPFDLTYEMFNNYRKTSRTALLICPGLFADNAEWSGMPVSTLLAEAGIQAEARSVSFHSVEGDLRNMPLADALGAGVFLADMVNGQALTASHGFPLRLVRSGYYGSDWLKWVKSVEVT